MRFDPRLIHPDDDGPGGERDDRADPGLPVGDLPPHLEALAQQLEADAARLSGKYPPGRLRSDQYQSGVETPAASRRSRPARWVVQSAVAALVLLAVGTALFDWARSQGNARLATAQSGGNGGQPAVEASTIVQVAEATGDHAVPADRGSPTRRDSLPQESPPAGLPAMLFHDLSAPQQEAVLDLLEEHGLEHMDLSI